MRTTFVDTGDEIVEVPWADIEGKKQNRDGSWNFTLVGGPFNGITVRVYPPNDKTVFPTDPPAVYELHPPIRKNGKWVMVHNPLGDPTYKKYNPDDYKPRTVRKLGME